MNQLIDYEYSDWDDCWNIVSPIISIAMFHEMGPRWYKGPVIGIT